MNRFEWILIESNGGAEAEPPEFSERLTGKPEAYRYVLRQSRYEPTPLIPSAAASYKSSRIAGLRY